MLLEDAICLVIWARREAAACELDGAGRVLVDDDDEEEDIGSDRGNADLR